MVGDFGMEPSGEQAGIKAQRRATRARVAMHGRSGGLMLIDSDRSEHSRLVAQGRNVKPRNAWMCGNVCVVEEFEPLVTRYSLMRMEEAPLR
jgi:hypothetical protein